MAASYPDRSVPIKPFLFDLSASFSRSAGQAIYGLPEEHAEGAERPADGIVTGGGFLSSNAASEDHSVSDTFLSSSVLSLGR
jgi:hypothetical protein